jgi:hypothetical protein
MDLLTILLSAFAPVAVEAAKAGVNRYITPDTFKPANIEDFAKMQALEIQRFQIMNDSAGAPQWVQAVIKMQRPIVAACCLSTWVYLKVTHVQDSDVQTMAQCVFFYLFGERTLLKTGKA